MPLPEKYNETEILAELKAGNKEAFTILYKKFSVQIYCNVFKMVKDEACAEEIVQEIFTRIWQKREIINIDVSFAGYIYRIAQNCVYDYYRTLQRNRHLLDKFKDQITCNYLHVEEEIYKKERNFLLQKALDTLPPQQKKVYQHCVLEGCTYRDTAFKMEIGHNTVKEYLSKARMSIRTFLEKNMDNPFALVILFMVDAS